MFKVVSILYLITLSSISKGNSQNIQVKVDTVYQSIDSIPFSISIYSKDSLNFPIKTEITEGNEEFTFIQNLLETYEHGNWKSVKYQGYVDYLPAYIFMKTIKSTSQVYVRNMGGVSTLLKKERKYRIKFLTYFNKYNNGIPMKSTKWYYFEVL